MTAQPPVTTSGFKLIAACDPDVNSIPVITPSRHGGIEVVVIVPDLRRNVGGEAILQIQADQVIVVGLVIVPPAVEGRVLILGDYAAIQLRRYPMLQ